MSELELLVLGSYKLVFISEKSYLLQKDKEAIKVARGILRRDAAFLDMSCALTAFLWAAGETAAAESEWNKLQQAQGAFLSTAGVQAHTDTSYTMLSFACPLTRFFGSTLESDTGQIVPFVLLQCVLAVILECKDRQNGGHDELCVPADGLGGFLYSKTNALDRIKGRWPPRPTAALDAFLGMDRIGVAQNYDGKMEQYTF